MRYLLDLDEKQINHVISSLEFSIETFKIMLEKGKASKPTDTLRAVNELQSVLEIVNNQKAIEEFRLRR